MAQAGADGVVAQAGAIVNPVGPENRRVTQTSLRLAGINADATTGEYSALFALFQCVYTILFFFCYFFLPTYLQSVKAF